MISISYNKDLFLLIVLATFIINGGSQLILGLIKTEKSTAYGTTEVITGLLNIAVFIAVLIF